jgi:hypothetical protein
MKAKSFGLQVSGENNYANHLGQGQKEVFSASSRARAIRHKVINMTEVGVFVSINTLLGAVKWRPDFSRFFILT